jgi:hypothetical protein
LVRVVDVKVKTATTEDFGEYIARGGDALSGSAPNTNSERLPHPFPSQEKGFRGTRPRDDRIISGKNQDGFCSAILKCEPAYTRRSNSGRIAGGRASSFANRLIQKWYEMHPSGSEFDSLEHW